MQKKKKKKKNLGTYWLMHIVPRHRKHDDHFPYVKPIPKIKKCIHIYTIYHITYTCGNPKMYSIYAPL